MNHASDFASSAQQAFQFNKSLADRAMQQLGDGQLHQALDPNTNSIAVIAKHVAGNLLSRFTEFLTSDGEKPWRNRDQEFVDTFKSRAEMLEYWESGWNCLHDALAGLSENDLSKSITIRGEAHSVALAVHRALGHTGYHVGQIVLIARVLAKDQWQTLTIPGGQSATFNQQVWGQTFYGQDDGPDESNR